MSGPIHVVFISGMSRSGSTVLDRLLGARPGVTSLGEVHQIWRRGFLEDHLCGCGVPFSRCPFWKQVRALPLLNDLDLPRVLQLQDIAVAQRPLLRRLKTASADAALREQARSAYSTMLVGVLREVQRLTSSSVLVDSSKQPAHGAVLDACPDVRVTTVHLVRDSRAVAFSTSRRKRKPDVHLREAWMTQLSPRLSAERWVKSNLKAELLGRRGGNYLRLRYEDLIASPADAVESILRLGPGTAGTGDAPVRVPVAHTVSGNPMRFEQGDLTLRLDDEWRQAMPRQDRRLVTALTAPLLLRYGYLKPWSGAPHAHR